jgi:hypothetical protein
MFKFQLRWQEISENHQSPYIKSKLFQNIWNNIYCTTVLLISEEIATDEEVEIVFEIIDQGFNEFFIAISPQEYILVYADYLTVIDDIIDEALENEFFETAANLEKLKSLIDV